MNLHGIATGATSAVNPEIDAVLLKSVRYSESDDGSQVPVYTSASGKIQVQGLSGKDLAQVNNLNIQGVLRTVYAYGNMAGLVRAEGRGGDIFQFPEYTGGPVRNWLVVMVKESWPDWCSVVVCLQGDQ
jgi:hypothetical protein